MIEEVWTRLTINLKLTLYCIYFGFCSDLAASTLTQKILIKYNIVITVFYIFGLWFSDMGI